jgi:Holliday junction resolvase
MSGRQSRDKGSRTERAIVSALCAAGIAAKRVPMCGACGGRFAGDVVVPVMGRDFCIEVKAQAGGFRQFYDWLDGRDVLIVKSNYKKPLVLVLLSPAAKIAKGIA